MVKSRAEYQAIFAKLKKEGKLTAYDLKNKKKDVEIIDPKLVFMQNGVGAVRGTSKLPPHIAVYKILPSKV